MTTASARTGQVFKFGGTSVGSVERIEHVADLVAKHRPLAVVVSAMAGETNRLIDLGRLISNETAVPEYDMLVASGEQVSVALLSLALRKRGIEPTPMLASHAQIRTDSLFSNASIRSIAGQQIRTESEAGRMAVIAGFQGLNEAGQITSLGRGGSDTSAVAVAAAMQARECIIYTDVDGVYTTDPRICAQARLIPQINYEEMMELSSQGSKVLHMRSVQLAARWGIRLVVRNTFKDEGGTVMLAPGEAHIEGESVTGVAATQDEVWVRVGPIPYEPTRLGELFTYLAENKINVDIINQQIERAGDSKQVFFHFTVSGTDLQNTRRALSHWAIDGLTAIPTELREDVGKVSIVGVGMKTNPGVAAQMFRCLARAGIEVLLVTTSEIKVAVLVERRSVDDAVRVLHAHFFEQAAAD